MIKNWFMRKPREVQPRCRVMSCIHREEEGIQVLVISQKGNIIRPIQEIPTKHPIELMIIVDHRVP